MKRINTVLILGIVTSLCYSLFYFALITTCAHYFENQQLYIIQLGVYKEKKYVDDLANKLKDKDIAYFTYEQDNEYYLFRAISKNIDEINNIKNELKQQQINFVIKKIAYQDYRLDELLQQKDYLKVLERIKYEDITISQE